MRINAHCHIFNLYSIFTKGTRDILEGRLQRMFPDVRLLNQLVLDSPEAYLEHKVDGSVCEVGILGEPYFREAERAVGEVTGHQSSNLWLEVKDWLCLSSVDAFLADARVILEFVRVAMMTSMDRTTDYLFDHMAAGQREGNMDRGEFLIVPLMMDILSEGWKDMRPDLDTKELELVGVRKESTLWESIGVQANWLRMVPGMSGQEDDADGGSN